MQQYQTFIFDSYGFDESARRITLTYALDNDIRFEETITLPADVSLSITDREALDRALFGLHLIGGISYFKTCLPKTIEIRSGVLTKEQAAFWNDVYENGLGEFFFTNKIDFRGLINFPVTTDETPSIPPPDSRKVHALTPIGGGKDSLVTIELLKSECFPQTLLRVGSHPFITQMAKTADVPLMEVGRALSPKLFELNEQGALNGHVPITAYLSFLSIVLGELYGYSHVVFSNEESANQGNTVMHGKEINHQWSKSIAFEKAFRTYVQTFITKNVDYFSLLRPLTEMTIVQMFAQFPQYLDQFTSCNANWRILKDQPTNRWCGHCPKCAFAFALLAAFLPKEDVLHIFNGNDLFADDTLLPLYRELLGIEGIKPFECVGTPEETYTALALAAESGEWNGSVVLKLLDESAARFPDPEAAVEKAFAISDDHCIPDAFQSLIP